MHSHGVTSSCTYWYMFSMGRCSCDQGYQLDPADGRSCWNVNECDASHQCDHFCVDSQGDYSCGCRQGYALAADARSCQGQYHLRQRT